MKSARLAVAIPTYNRSEVIREFLDNAAKRYIKNGFDIFFYDSSEDNKTEVIVREWERQHEAIHYVKIGSTVHANRKVYDIFREFGSLLEYDYLWMCADSIRWEQNVLDAVKLCIKEEYDIVIIDHTDVEGLGNREYRDKNSLFLDCAWMMTFFGATILKTETMLANADWDILLEKYMVPDSINHSHVAYYFEQIDKLERWKALHLSVDAADRKASDLKLYSGWHKEVFYVWCHCWAATINKLPSDYIYKAEVIKKHGINSGLFCLEHFKQFRREGILNLAVYREYKKEWWSITDVSRMRIWFISVLPTWAVDGWKHRKEAALKRKLKKFCSRFDKLYIYGAGSKARKYSMLLYEMNIPFVAYLVSDMQGNVQFLGEHEVIVFRKELLENMQTGILLALNKENTDEVMKKYMKDVRHAAIFSEYRADN